MEEREESEQVIRHMTQRETFLTEELFEARQRVDQHNALLAGQEEGSANRKSTTADVDSSDHGRVPVARLEAVRRGVGWCAGLRSASVVCFLSWISMYVILVLLPGGRHQAVLIF